METSKHPCIIKHIQISIQKQTATQQIPQETKREPHKRRVGLKELQQSNEIVIQKAYKGSAVVVMNTKDYLTEGYRQLSDSNFYSKIDHDPTAEIIDKILSKMKQTKTLSDKNIELLSPENTKEGKVYLLPKIHKKGIPGRPICSSVNHPTSNIS